MPRIILALVTAVLVGVLYILNQPEVQQSLANLYQGWRMP